MPFTHQGFNHGLVGSGSGGGSSGAEKIVTVSTTTNINLASAPATIDGYSLTLNDTILVKDQTPDAGSGNPNNGPYLWNGNAVAMTRLTGFTVWSEFVGLNVFVSNGATNVGSTWVSLASAGGTLGITDLKFQKTGQNLTFNNGITQTGNVVTLTNVAPVANQFVSSVVGGNLVLSALPVNPIPANTAYVARNGIDGTPLNATIDGALTSITSSLYGEVVLYTNYNNTVAYDMPTLSINKRNITGTDNTDSIGGTNYCAIQAINNILPISNNDEFSLINCNILGSPSIPTPIIINNKTSITITIQNVQGAGYAINPCILISGVCSGNIYFNQYVGTLTITGSPNPFMNLYFNNCDVTIINTSTSASQYFIYYKNSKIKGASTSGYWDVENTDFTDDFVFTGTGSDYVQLVNCSTAKNVPFGSYYKLTIAGSTYARITNCDTDHNENVYNSTTFININSNKVINLDSSITPTYNLTLSSAIINVDCASGQCIINLPSLTSLTFSSVWLGKSFAINKLDSSTNKLTFSANGTDKIYKGSTQSGSVDYTGSANITLSINYINSVYCWISA